MLPGHNFSRSDGYRLFRFPELESTWQILIFSVLACSELDKMYYCGHGNIDPKIEIEIEDSDLRDQNLGHRDGYSYQISSSILPRPEMECSK